MQHRGAISGLDVMDGWIGQSPGGVRYRAPCGANKIYDHSAQLRMKCENKG